MKATIIFASILFTICSGSFAQSQQNRKQVKPSEQKEIKADKNLEKEIQHKQLRDKPVMLGEPKANKAVTRDSSVRSNQKRKHSRKS